MAEILIADGSFSHRFFAGTSCAFGVFDGLHQGHRFLLSCAQETAVATGGKSVALTFDIDPDEVFHPDRLKKLMGNRQRIAALAQSGVDAVVVLPFTPSFSAESPDTFLHTTFNGTVPAALHVGLGFRFGAKAAGTVEELRAWGEGVGTTIYAHELESEDGLPITATRVRGLLQECELAAANRLLGHPYRIEGVVEPGRGEGAGLGFKTANLSLSPQFQVLGTGVYAGYAEVEGMRYCAAMSVGISPVFADQSTATCEVHILDFTGDLYGAPLAVEFVHLLRPMVKFDTVEELVATVKRDIAWTRQHL